MGHQSTNMFLSRVCPALLLLLLVVTQAQQVGHQKTEEHLPMNRQSCTSSGCQSEPAAVVLDANWRWVHKTGTSTNCYTGSSWDSSLCPDPVTCAANCALGGVPTADWHDIYGVATTDNTLKMQLVTKGNVGGRTYLTDGGSNYRMFKLKNREFSLDVDMSQLACGLNGALYFVKMQTDGGMAEFSGNKAGAQYGTGYCDAQCPRDMKFINGEANTKDWTPAGSSTGEGHYGSCCTEMDVWEANSQAAALTPHP